MAPDLDSLPPLSQQRPQPVSPLVVPVPNILPSNTSVVLATSGPASPAMPVHTSTVEDNSAVGSGPGPVRHPRPLTAAELHSELEREQEAVVSSSHLSYYYLKTVRLTDITGQPSHEGAFHAPRCSECLGSFEPLLRLRLWSPRWLRQKPHHLRSLFPSPIATSRKPQSLLLVH